jgi:hypothetical protein
MARYAYLVKYTREGTGGTKQYRTTFNCAERVAKFFEIEGLVYTPSPEDVVDRAGYTREYTKADGTVGSVTVAAGKIVYKGNSSRACGKKVFVTTGAKTTKGTRKTLALTFPSFLSVAEISDALGEIIPSGKIATTATVGASEIAPFFTIRGGGTYAIMTKTAADASTKTDVATTEAEQTALTAATESKTK